jgi:hypothetical protein
LPTRPPLPRPLDDWTNQRRALAERRIGPRPGGSGGEPHHHRPAPKKLIGSTDNRQVSGPLGVIRTGTTTAAGARHGDDHSCCARRVLYSRSHRGSIRATPGQPRSRDKIVSGTVWSTCGHGSAPLPMTGRVNPGHSLRPRVNPQVAKLGPRALVAQGIEQRFPNPMRQGLAQGGDLRLLLRQPTKPGRTPRHVCSLVPCPPRPSAQLVADTSEAIATSATVSAHPVGDGHAYVRAGRRRHGRRR